MSREIALSLQMRSRRAKPGDDAVNDLKAVEIRSNARIVYGAIQVALRAGAKPTGTRAVSFKDLRSTTETLFVCSLAT